MTLILVTGSYGQVGRALSARHQPGKREIIGFDRDELDITDLDQVRAAIAAKPYAAVVNAAAYTAVDKAEGDRDVAYAINRDGPENLARASAERGIPLLHISTDYVFDGTRDGAYREDDATGPTGVYGASKLAGEAAVRAANPRHIILRTSWVYAVSTGNFVATMLRLAAERPELRVVADQRGGPTEAGAIADALLTITELLGQERVDSGLWGTYHFSGAPATTWHGFAQAIVAAGVPRLRMVPTVTPIRTADYPTPARRPANSVLDCSKIAARFGIRQPDWTQSLAAVVEAIQTTVLAPQQLPRNSAS
ncbi:NAD(P)-dependent oxidoreductase [Aliidongia dinghuensis]|uniref:dTDP-4-dehydrorhamnose reductase n=1 Tax=Aliidongia dinghuensis TaxID=1867774 RepID=A0A8J2YW38_9PROT|nr:dTDP-4-dehydrorhamnose reductase [Aliidongia dinghuensis]GGF27091.1 NAD(P)-dependent oxidoreductase [Aliidongia dinghuensis]